MELPDLDVHLIHDSLDPRKSASPKRHLDRFSRFCTANLCAQHTDIQTTLHATSVAIGRISYTACRRCGAKILKIGLCLMWDAHWPHFEVSALMATSPRKEERKKEGLCLVRIVVVTDGQVYVCICYIICVYKQDRY